MVGCEMVMNVLEGQLRTTAQKRFQLTAGASARSRPLQAACESILRPVAAVSYSPRVIKARATHQQTKGSQVPQGTAYHTRHAGNALEQDDPQQPSLVRQEDTLLPQLLHALERRRVLGENFSGDGEVLVPREKVEQASEELDRAVGGLVSQRDRLSPDDLDTIELLPVSSDSRLSFRRDARSRCRWGSSLSKPRSTRSASDLAVPGLFVSAPRFSAKGPT